MLSTRLIALSSFALLAITAGTAETCNPRGVLACKLGALTPVQRTRHTEMTRSLLKEAKRTELRNGYLFTIDRDKVSAADLAEWTADEARCCPFLDFRLDLPAQGPLQIRLEGGRDVKAFLAHELGL